MNHELAAVAHVHSTFSDGTATVPEIVDVARASGADALLLTDHDTLAARHHGLEGWHDGVLLLAGHEISPKAGHFLAFGLDREVDHRGRDELSICHEVRRRGGFGFAAHPFSRGSRMLRTIAPPHPWRALDECGCGIELWSLTTDAAEGWRSPREAIAFLRHPERAVTGPPQSHLREWDRLCARRRVPAIGGLDAHQVGLRIAGRVLSPMSHQRYFRLLRTHLLLSEPPAGELARDRSLVEDALREGRCFLALDGLADARGFAFRARTREGREVAMGSELAAGPCTLEIESPHSARLRVLRDGAPLAEGYGRRLEHVAEAPGAYRVEAVLRIAGRDRRWVVTNPVYLREETAR